MCPTQRLGVFRAWLHLPLEVHLCLRRTWRILHRCRWSILAAALATLGIGLMLWSYDAQAVQAVSSAGCEQIQRLARQISYWGDYPTGIALICTMMFTVGWIIRRRSWRQAALAVLLAATVAGATANCLRLTLGRPRPAAELPDGFYGLQRKAKFHGFPSGHAATAFGAAGALAIVFPPAAIPALGAAASVGWSRIKLRRHYPTDILVGGFIGLVCGAAFGAAVRRPRALPVTIPATHRLSSLTGLIPVGWRSAVLGAAPTPPSSSVPN